ncbi:hypothetical protein [Pantoea sp. AS-PWVM4]|uniref:hypothetical protein n=1 Tax=Pantoea sp. AS-PWVM4 TaxID=1332069 RepID=UPI00055BE8E7|nr:hypothetical protein [Pantoea sp. AS-PWVM4]
MLKTGFVTRKALAEWRDVPFYLPEFQFHEKHLAVIHTPVPEKILSAVAEFDIRQDRVIRALMSVRQFPQKLRSHPPDEAFNSFGLHSFTPLVSSASELCFGLRGQFWRADFGLEPVPDASAYQQAVEPGSAKLLLRYRVRQLMAGQHELCTETFIYCPDLATQCRMAAYWLAIRAGSGWIRKRTLMAVKAKVENSETTPGVNK